MKETKTNVKISISIPGLIAACIVLYGIIKYELYPLYLPQILILLVVSIVSVVLAIYSIECLDWNALGIIFFLVFSISSLGLILEIGLLVGGSVWHLICDIAEAIGIL